jgi:Transglycosylase-like domain
MPAAAVSESIGAEPTSGTQTCPPTRSAALPLSTAVHRAFRRSTTVLAITALLAVGFTTGATAANGSTPGSLRAQVDAIGARYLAAQERAHALDARLQTLDQQLAVSERQSRRLLPVARAHAVQLYQAGTQGFTVLFDTGSAIESARRAELISRADDHTQALIDEYARSAAKLQLERGQVAAARAEQAKLVASLAAQEHTLQGALAAAQARYRAALAATARAEQARSTTTARAPDRVPVIPVSSPPSTPQPTPPPPAPPGVNPHHDDPFLVCTRTRESSGNYAAVNPGGYYGAYQFSPTTWDLTASHAGLPQLIGVRPDAASPWDQDQLAWVLYQWQGNGPWGGLC